MVALLAEGVDRNDGDSTELEDIARVALLAEGVDRNHLRQGSGCGEGGVALLAEGVDRNCSGRSRQSRYSSSPSSRRAWIEINLWWRMPVRTMSPSSRRAWIEIFRSARLSWISAVALLAEGVDRNFFHPLRELLRNWSPSSRRAWIEIFCSCSSSRLPGYVALLAEGVDRN